MDEQKEVSKGQMQPDDPSGEHTSAVAPRSHRFCVGV